MYFILSLTQSVLSNKKRFFFPFYIEYNNMIIWCIIAVVGIQIIYFIIYNIQNDMIVRAHITKIIMKMVYYCIVVAFWYRIGFLFYFLFFFHYSRNWNRRIEHNKVTKLIEHLNGVFFCSFFFVLFYRMVSWTTTLCILLLSVRHVICNMKSSIYSKLKLRSNGFLQSWIGCV